MFMKKEWFAEEDVLHNKSNCGWCGCENSIVGYCNNSIMTDDYQAMNDCDGDYVYFCTKDNCIGNIGVYGNHDLWLLTDDVSDNHLAQAIKNLHNVYMKELLQFKYFSDVEYRELVQKYNKLESEHRGALLRDVDRAIILSKELVEINLKIIELDKANRYNAFVKGLNQDVVKMIKDSCYVYLKVVRGGYE